MPYLKRNVTQRVRAALADTPVVALNGPRQVGTTTLARGLAFPGSTDYLSLDDESLRKSARLNPLEFLERGVTPSSLTRSSSSRGSSVPSSCLSIAIAAPAVFSSPVPVAGSQHPIWPTPSSAVSRRSNSRHSPKGRSRIAPTNSSILCSGTERRCSGPASCAERTMSNAWSSGDSRMPLRGRCRAASVGSPPTRRRHFSVQSRNWRTSNERLRSRASWPSAQPGPRPS